MSYKPTWKQYRKECLISNVEPCRADFKAGEPEWLFRLIESQQPIEEADALAFEYELRNTQLAQVANA